MPAASEGKSCTFTRSGQPRPPLGAAVGEVADLLLLLGVDRDDRLPGVQVSPAGRRCSGTGRPGPGAGGPRRPSRCPAGCSPRPQQPRHRPVRHRCPAAVSARASSRVDFTSSAAATPDPPATPGPPAPSAPEPAAGRSRPASCGPRRAPAPAAPARPPPPAPTAHRVRVHPRGHCHRLDAAAAQLQRLRPQQQPPLPLIQMRAQQPVQPRHLLACALPALLTVRHTTNGRPSGAENLAYFAPGAKRRHGCAGATGRGRGPGGLAVGLRKCEPVPAGGGRSGLLGEPRGASAAREHSRPACGGCVSPSAAQGGGLMTWDGLRSRTRRPRGRTG